MLAMLCGGTGQVKDATDEVQLLVDGVKDAVGQELGAEVRELKATHFKTQVVAGTNFFVRVEDGEGKTLHLRIYRHFSGTVQLHAVKHAEATEEVAHFEGSLKGQ